MVFTILRYDRQWTIGPLFTRPAPDESAAVFVPPPAYDLAQHGSSADAGRAWPFLLEGSSPVLEEFLLPAVKDRWLETHFVAQLRDGLLLQQVPPQDGDLLFRRVLLPLLLQAFSPLPYWENALSISS